MATMATPADQPLKKLLGGSWLVITPPPLAFIFFSSFNLGVARVAMVATGAPRGGDGGTRPHPLRPEGAPKRAVSDWRDLKVY